jgi:hypothetical protein
MNSNCTSVYGLDKYNVIFVTLDSCRYDTLNQANTPFIKQIGSIRKAKTHGTYTVPAHLSFFMGYIPIVDEPPFEPYYSETRQLWRLKTSRARKLNSIGITLNGQNVIEGYRNIGFKTIGTGGVRWFRNPTLTESFDNFLFFGPDDQTSVFTSRKKEDFSLNHQEQILEIVKDNKYFLFINCLETHVPYDFGEGMYSKDINDIIQRGSPIWGCKHKNMSKINVTANELKKLHKQQIRALESIDNKLRNLIAQLPKPLLIVICADHGECFGENMLWGHGYPAKQVLDVPLIIGKID